MCGLFVYKNGGIILRNFKSSKSWHLVLLFSVFALVVVACGGGAADEEVVEEDSDETLQEAIANILRKHLKG